MNQSNPGSKKNHHRVNQNSSFGIAELSELIAENDLGNRDS